MFSLYEVGNTPVSVPPSTLTPASRGLGHPLDSPREGDGRSHNRTADPMLARAWHALRSRRLAIALLIGLGLLPIAGTIFPQQDRVGPMAYGQWAQANPRLAQLAARLSLDSLYSAWWFSALFALLGANTLACTLPQLRGAFLRTVRRPSPAGLDRRPATRQLPLRCHPGEALSVAEAELRSRGYRVMPLAGGLLGQKGILGVWGSPLFHLGLVVVLTGAMVGGLLHFSGYVEVAEGQGFLEEKGAYLQQTQGPLFGRLGPLVEGHRGFALQLDRFAATGSNWGSGISSDLVSEVTLLEDGRQVRRSAIRINEPLEYRGLKIYQTGAFGPAPVFQLELPDGSRDSGVVNLARQGDDQYGNSLYLPGTGYRMTVRAREGDAAVEVEIFERKLSLLRSRLQPGQSVEIDDVRLTLSELRRWTGLRIVADPGIIILYPGFALVILGLALSFLVVPREIWVATGELQDGSVLQLGGRSPRLKALFAAEFEGLAEALQARVEGKAGVGGHEAWTS